MNGDVPFVVDREIPLPPLLDAVKLGGVGEGPGPRRRRRGRGRSRRCRWPMRGGGSRWRVGLRRDVGSVPGSRPAKWSSLSAEFVRSSEVIDACSASEVRFAYCSRRHIASYAKSTHAVSREVDRTFRTSSRSHRVRRRLRSRRNVSDSHLRLLLAQAMNRAQPPDQFDAVDADHLVLRQMLLKNLDRLAVVLACRDTSAPAARR